MHIRARTGFGVRIKKELTSTAFTVRIKGSVKTIRTRQDWFGDFLWFLRHRCGGYGGKHVTELFGAKCFPRVH